MNLLKQAALFHKLPLSWGIIMTQNYRVLHSVKNLLIKK